jgi:toxin ParE1/3/4
MTGYRFLSPAEDEMAEAALFYDGHSTGLGRDFLDDVQQSINRLRAYPQLGAEVETGLRRLLLHRFPFSLIYAVDPREILIVSVAHHGRHPSYWRSRVE